MTMSSHIPVWYHPSGPRGVSKSTSLTVLNRRLRSRSSYRSRGCSSSQARRFGRSLPVTACACFRRLFLQPSSASHRIVSHPIPLITHNNSSFLPSYPTDNVASNDGTPGSYELFTTSCRLHSPSHYSPPSLASVIVPVLSRLHHLLHAILKLVQCILQNFNILLWSLVTTFSLYIMYVLSALFRHCYRLFQLVVATPSGIGGRPCVSLCTTLILCYSLPYHWTVYTELPSACEVTRMGCVFGLRGFSPISLVHYG